MASGRRLNELVTKRATVYYRRLRVSCGNATPKKKFTVCVFETSFSFEREMIKCQNKKKKMYFLKLLFFSK